MSRSPPPSPSTVHFAPQTLHRRTTLLSAMENAGKEDIPEDVERRGLGTPGDPGAGHH